MRSINLFILFFSFAACQQSPPSKRIIFRYNQPYTVTSLDPAFARNNSNIWSVDPLFNTLIQLDDSLHTKPCVASHWETDAAGKKIIFHLRKDVFFHDDECFAGGKGRRVIAKDFVYSFLRILEPEVNSPGSWIFKGRVDSLNPFIALNDSTFQINLCAPFSPILQILTMQYCSVIPEEAIKKYGKDFRSHPVGTGPFKLVRWIEGQTMILTKNDKYFEEIDGHKLPLVDGVRIEFIGDRKSAFLQLLEGKIDFISGFDPGLAYEIFTRDGRLRDKYKKQINYYQGPYLNLEYLGINPNAQGASPFLNDKKFRQALNYGFDRNELLRTIRRGIGTPAIGGMVPVGLPAFDTTQVKGYQFDAQKAKLLLRQSGYLQLEYETRPILELYSSKEYADYCLFIIRQWESLGIRCKLSLSEAATIREMMRKGEVALFKANWTADYPDAENFLILFEGNQLAPPNYTRFHNTQYDRIYKELILQINPAKQYSLIHQMENIVLNDAPGVFIFYDAASIFTSKKIIHYQPNAMNLLKLKFIQKEPTL